MGRPKSNKKSQSINFDDIVLERAKEFCKKRGVDLSPFVNKAIKEIVVSEYEFCRHMAAHHAAEMQKWITLRDSAKDAPTRITIEKTIPQEEDKDERD